MPSKKTSAPTKPTPAGKSGGAKDAKSSAKNASKPTPKAPAKPAPKAPAKPAATPPKPVAKPAPKPATKPPAKPVVNAKAPAPPAKPGVKPKPIPFTIKNERAQPPAKPAASSKAPPPKIDPKAPPKPDARLASFGPKAKYTVMTADAMAASRAAAAKLAAAAGLMPVKNTSNGDAPARNYTRVTKSPFDKKELAEFREMLLTKRRQIEGDVNAMESEALTGGGGALSHLPQHMADQGTDTFDQSLALDLAASQRGLLKEIDDALARIENNTYGVCEEMGKPIGVERLRHTPWARYCIEAARQHERAAYFR